MRARATHGMGQCHPISPMKCDSFEERPIGRDETENFENHPIPWDKHLLQKIFY